MNIIKKYPLRSFYLIAFAFSGFCWTLSQFIAYKSGYSLYTSDSLSGLFKYGFNNLSHFLVYLLFFAAVYGPLLATAIVRSATSNVKSKPTDKKFKKSLCLILLLPLLINLLALMLGSLLSGKMPIFSNLYPIAMIVPFFIYQVVTSGMEEPGWRGFLLPELIKKYGVDKAGWLSGLLWGFWHIPIMIPMYWSLGVMGLMSVLVGFFAAIIAQAYIFTWIHQNTKSTLMAVLFHASLNTFSIFIIGTTTNPTVAILPALLSWVAVFVLEKISDKTTYKLNYKKSK